MPRAPQNFFTRPIDRRIELKRALLGVAVGLFFVPLLVFSFGRLALGPFEGSIGSFLAQFYSDLLKAAPGAIAFVLGPYARYVLARVTAALAGRAGR